MRRSDDPSQMIRGGAPRPIELPPPSSLISLQAPGAPANAMRYSRWNRQGRAFRLPKWQLAVLLVAAIAIGIAVAIVATGVFLIALPVAALVALGYRLFGGARRRRAGPDVIEGEYEVVEAARRRPGRGADRS
jgi:hypothetical protein